MLAILLHVFRPTPYVVVDDGSVGYTCI